MKRFGLIVVLGFFVNTFVYGASDPTVVTSVYLDPALGENETFVPLKFLVEEINKRIPAQVSVDNQIHTDEGQVLLVGKEFSDWSEVARDLLQSYPLPAQQEGFRILSAGNQIYIQGVDFRGLLYGSGYFLRNASYADNVQWNNVNVSTIPDKSIRGHQLGYRETANSYDAWTVDQYEQYLKDLIVFGANSIENIPFHEDHSTHFSIPQKDMQREVSRLSEKYDLNYWIWSQIEFDLTNQEKSQAYLEKSETLYKELPKLDAVFVPAGDPGDNPPELLLPMMKEMAVLLQKYHPDSKLWLSLQGFEDHESKYVYNYLNENRPAWIGGLVAGPGSPPMSESREAIPDQYALRHYPDITHTVRCQYSNWWWDPVFSFTLGREPVNPQPLRYQNIYRHTEQFTDGFLAYSDGMHDDLNKMVWSQLGWNSAADINRIVKEYANYFLDSQKAGRIADGLFALEQNWDGAIKHNGSITGTLELWKNLTQEKESDEILNNWRWKMYLLRAYYDALMRKRFIYEEKLELQANAILRKSKELGSAAVIDSVKSILSRSDTYFRDDPWRNRIYELADDLFEIIGYQTSVPQYRAMNSERGAIIDFVDRPLNNRWWIETEFERMARWPAERKVERLTQIGYWETPGEGSFYDDVGNIYKSPHVVKVHASDNDPFFEMSDNPGFDWWEDGYSKARLSWMSNMRWPVMEYHGLEPGAEYTIRLAGVGEFYTYADGKALKPVTERQQTGEIVELSVPQSLTKDGSLKLTWQNKDEGHLNWRQHSRLNEVWLIKK